MAANVITAEAGQSITFSDGETGTVLKPCANKTNGYWYCAKCKQRIDTNFPPTKHERAGRHLMVWMCMEHGPEQPQ